MRARTLILFVVAIMLAGGTAMLVRSWLARQHSTEAKADVPPAPLQKSILVTRGVISRGQILKPTDLAWQPWPDAGLDRSYVQSGSKSIDSFAGWVAREPFGPGEPLTEAKIFPGDQVDILVSEALSLRRAAAAFLPRHWVRACVPSRFRLPPRHRMEMAPSVKAPRRFSMMCA